MEAKAKKQWLGLGITALAIFGGYKMYQNWQAGQEAKKVAAAAIDSTPAGAVETSSFSDGYDYVDGKKKSGGWQ